MLLILVYVNEGLRKIHNLQRREKEIIRLIFINREFKETSFSPYYEPVK